MSLKKKFTITASIFVFLSAVLVPAAFGQTLNFGNSQVGSQTASTFGGLYVSNFTSPGNFGNITQIQVYMATGGTTAQAVMYLDVNGEPGALVASSAPVNVEGTSGRWVSFDVSYNGIPSFNYWIGVFFQNAATYYFNPNQNGTAITYAGTSELATTFPAGSKIPETSLSVYAVYTPSSGKGQSDDWIQYALLLIVIIGVVLAVILVLIPRLKGQKKTETSDSTKS